MNVPHPEDPDVMLEYDLSGEVVRGKYAQRYALGRTVIVLEPDVAKMFPDSEAVNKALRALGEIITEQARHKPKGRSKRPVASK